jgi:hypothetical protein
MGSWRFRLLSRPSVEIFVFVKHENAAPRALDQSTGHPPFLVKPKAAQDPPQPFHRCPSLRGCPELTRRRPAEGLSSAGGGHSGPLWSKEAGPA